MRTRARILVILFALSVLAAAVAVAQTSETLTGCLEKAADGSFTLAEKGKTDKVMLHGGELAAHVGHTVKITGSWQTDGGKKFFHVTMV
jgi:hypothetical protein